MAPPDDYQLRPMSEFVEAGWLAMLNLRVANPAGVQVGIYIDDDDGRTALGWAVLSHPIEADADLELERITQFFAHLSELTGGTAGE